MRYRDLMEGYSAQKTEERWGDALIRRYMDESLEHSRNPSTGLVGWPSDKKEWPPTRVSFHIITWFETIDPTAKNAYVPAFARWYATGSMKRLEDAPKAKSVILAIQKFANKLRDIKPMEMTFDEFLDLGDTLLGQKSRSEKAAEEEQAFYDAGDAKVFLNNDWVKIVIPYTIDAAQFFGRGTRWCTASKEDNMFMEYAEDGPLFNILFKGEDRRWQFHFESHQFMDERDTDIVEGPLLDKVMDLFKPYIRDKVLDHAKYIGPGEGNSIAWAIEYFDKPDVEFQRAAAVVLPQAISAVLVDEMDHEAFKIALEKSSNFGWIATMERAQSIPEWMQWSIAKNKFIAIRMVEKPIPEVQKYLVEIDPANLELFTFPTQEAADIAIKADPSMITNLKADRQTPELQLLAVQSSPGSISYIHNPTPEAALVAIKHWPNTIMDLKLKPVMNNLEVQMAAVQSNYQLITFIPKPFPEVIKVAEKGRMAALRASRDVGREFGNRIDAANSR